MDGAMNSAPGVPFNLVTHRAMLHTLNLREGQIFEDRAFVSTTVSRRAMSDNFESAGGGTVFRINVPRGSRALYVDSISVGQGEKELLLPRGSKFKVDKVTKVNGQTRVEVTLQ